MAYNDVTDLIRFLGERAQEVSMHAVMASTHEAKVLEQRGGRTHGASFSTFTTDFGTSN